MSERIRLARLIASRGLASRREAEQMIADGLVIVNGAVVTEPGTTVDPEADHVRVDGRRLPPPPPPTYILLYKPTGYIVSRGDPDGRRGVMELLSGLEVRVEPVGRLDINTEGALLLTNDGDLAHKLTHPSFHVPKRYLAKVWRTPDERTIARIQRGVHLEDGRTAPCRARLAERTDGGNAWVEITVTEGRNRLIRRLMAAVNHPVSKLRRESFATISIRNLGRGEWRHLTGPEVERLQDLAAGRRPERAGKRRKKGFARAKPKRRRFRRGRSRPSR